MSDTRDKIARVVRSLSSKARGNAVIAQDEASNAVFCSLMGAVDEARDAGVSDRTMLALLKAVERHGGDRTTWRGETMATISGGDKLEAYLKGLAQKVAKASTVEIGFPEGSTHVDAKTGATMSLPLLAALNEFGRPEHNQPPRPFMRNTVAKHSAEWGEQVEDLLKANDYDAAATLGQLGEIVKGQMQNEIQTLQDPPLAASTIAKKKFSKPLIDSGKMAASVVSTVKE